MEMLSKPFRTLWGGGGGGTEYASVAEPVGVIVIPRLTDSSVMQCSLEQV